MGVSFQLASESFLISSQNVQALLFGNSIFSGPSLILYTPRLLVLFSEENRIRYKNLGSEDEYHVVFLCREIVISF